MANSVGKHGMVAPPLRIFLSFYAKRREAECFVQLSPLNEAASFTDFASNELFRSSDVVFTETQPCHVSQECHDVHAAPLCQQAMWLLISRNVDPTCPALKQHWVARLKGIQPQPIHFILKGRVSGI
jgi:hypothetical protein